MGSKRASTKGEEIFGPCWPPQPAPGVAALCRKKSWLGLECGGSDTTSGLFGNPALGLFTDWIVDAGGTAVFSEPVECLGGEELLEKRAVTPEVARQLDPDRPCLRATRQGAWRRSCRHQSDPRQLAGGLTSIEEKSLGALAKSGSRPIQGVLAYAKVRASGPAFG